MVIIHKNLSLLSQPLQLAPRQIPTTIMPQSVAHSSSSPSSGPRTASNSFLSTASTVDDDNSNVTALTDLHEQPVSSLPGPYYSLAVDNADGGGAMQEEMGGAILENKNEFEEASTEVSNASSSREDLTTASELEINMDRRERILNRCDKEDNDLNQTPIKELTYTEGSSLLSPVIHSTSHFSALSGLETVSPTKTELHTMAKNFVQNS